MSFRHTTCRSRDRRTGALSKRVKIGAGQAMAGTTMECHSLNRLGRSTRGAAACKKSMQHTLNLQSRSGIPDARRVAYRLPSPAGRRRRKALGAHDFVATARFQHVSCRSAIFERPLIMPGQRGRLRASPCRHSDASATAREFASMQVGPSHNWSATRHAASAGKSRGKSLEISGFVCLQLSSEDSKTKGDFPAIHPHILPAWVAASARWC